MKVKLLLLTRYSQLGASSRMRFLQFLPWFEQAGFRCTVAPFIDDVQLQKYYQGGRYGFFILLHIYWRRLWALVKSHKYELIWIEKEALPWLPAWFEVWLLRSGSYALDYDDAIFHNYDQHKTLWVRYLLGGRIDRLMMNSDLVLAGNAYLAQRASNAGAGLVEIIPTVIDLDRYTPKSASALATVKPLRIVWIGSPYTMKFLAILHEPLIQLSQKFQFKFRVIAGSRIDLPGVDVEFVPWSAETEAASIQACDIGVMPLIDSDWERGKCGYKLIQYMACGLPVVASAVGANCEIVCDGENGFLVRSENGWADVLGKLLSDVTLRQQMGKEGRKQVESKYCVQKIAPRLIELLSNAALSKRH